MTDYGQHDYHCAKGCRVGFCTKCNEIQALTRLQLGSQANLGCAVHKGNRPHCTQRN